MQMRLNISSNFLSLTQSPALADNSEAQEWCQQELNSGSAKPVVWFLKDAVYHLLRPCADTGRAADFYTGWEALGKQGVRLSVCQSAYQRRLPDGSLDEKLFELSTLTRWADDLTRQLDDSESEICCIVAEQAANPEFLRESIDPVLSLLAMEMPVSVLFTPPALSHLLDENTYRKWRLVPETEARARLIVQDSQVGDRERQLLLKRQGVQLLSDQDYSVLLANRSCVNV